MRAISPRKIVFQHEQSTGYTRNSSDKTLLLLPKFKLKKTFAARAFSVGGIKEWDGFPRNIRAVSNIDSFKTKLKAYLVFKGCEVLYKY